MIYRTPFLLIAIALPILAWQNIIIFPISYAIGSFVIWLILTFVLIHNKNKERNIPRPVYLTE